MRRKLAVAVGVVTFGAALAGFLLLGVEAQSGQVRVLAASQTIPAGATIAADSAFLSPTGTLVHLGAAALADTIPLQDYRYVQGALALVEIPAGAVILRSDLLLGASSSERQLTLNLASMPPNLTAGDRVDLLSVWGAQTGAIAPGADLCGTSATVGCVVPLAQSVLVLGANAPTHSITISVAPTEVAPWLLLDATQPIWAVTAGVVACAGSERAVSDPQAALQVIQGGNQTLDCSRSGALAGAAP